MDLNTWTDHGAIGVQSKIGDNYNAIDPNLVRAGNNYYLSYGSFWSDLFQVKMSSPPTKPASAQYALAFDPSGTHPIEGSFIYYRAGYYYLFYSAGVCCGKSSIKVHASSWSSDIMTEDCDRRVLPERVFTYH